MLGATGRGPAFPRPLFLISAVEAASHCRIAKSEGCLVAKA